ncbi:Putative acyl-CoA-binding protein [Acromyrmex echinatior]|uniref:Putative acyl-CoA-binding protein n=1 Tax=Acromyrmex echinatior TaxID=103372 RepID=F4WR30_ACREC|nr:Putative acyl-CoA-binding protein [Acromyrmex echinatior]
MGSKHSLGKHMENRDDLRHLSAIAAKVGRKWDENRFNDAATVVKKLAAQPEDQDLLELYALYKQSTIGDCNTERPGMLDFKGKAKWDAWNGKKSMGQETAKEQYITKVEALIASIGKK